MIWLGLLLLAGAGVAVGAAVVAGGDDGEQPPPDLPDAATLPEGDGDGDGDGEPPDGEGRPNPSVPIGQACNMGPGALPGQVRLLGSGNVRDRVCSGGEVKRPRIGMAVGPRPNVGSWPDGTIVKPEGGPTMMVWKGKLARLPKPVETLALIAAITSAQALALSLDPFMFAGAIYRYLGQKAPDLEAVGRLLALLVDGPQAAEDLKADGAPNQGLNF